MALQVTLLSLPILALSDMAFWIISSFVEVETTASVCCCKLLHNELVSCEFMSDYQLQSSPIIQLLVSLFNMENMGHSTQKHHAPFLLALVPDLVVDRDALMHRHSVLWNKYYSANEMNDHHQLFLCLLSFTLFCIIQLLVSFKH